MWVGQNVRTSAPNYRYSIPGVAHIPPRPAPENAKLQFKFYIHNTHPVFLLKIMKFNEYQKMALSTALPRTDRNIPYLALALCGEAGELADKVKKVMRDKDNRYYQPDLAAIALELGDVLWYAANLANSLGYSLSEIAELNIQKIKDRVERGTLHGSGDNR